jgi:hypothetical protein
VAFHFLGLMAGDGQVPCSIQHHGISLANRCLTDHTFNHTIPKDRQDIKLKMKRSASTSEMSPSEDGCGTWSRSTEMLESSMMMIAISEVSSIGDLNYKGSTGTLTSSRSSASCLSGWGNCTSRKSYKVDLATLGEPSSETGKDLPPASIDISTSQPSSEDGWGFFVESL